MSVFGLSICHRPCLSLLYRFNFIEITMSGGLAHSCEMSNQRKRFHFDSEPQQQKKCSMLLKKFYSFQFPELKL